MTPDDLFGEQHRDAVRVTHRAKLAELERELAMRRNVYPKQIEAGRLDESRASAQIAALEAIIADYQVRPWPSTLQLVKQWREAAEPLTVLGIRAPELHREELLAVLAFAVDALRRAGVCAKPPVLGGNPPESGTKRPKRGTGDPEHETNRDTSAPLADRKG